MTTACWYAAASGAFAAAAAPASGMTPVLTASTACAGAITPASARRSNASFCIRVLRSLYQTMPMSRMTGVRKIDPTTRKISPTIHGAPCIASLKDSKSLSESMLTVAWRRLFWRGVSVSSSFVALSAAFAEGGVVVTVMVVSPAFAAPSAAVAGEGAAASSAAIASAKNVRRAARAVSSGVHARAVILPCMEVSLMFIRLGCVGRLRRIHDFADDPAAGGAVKGLISHAIIRASCDAAVRYVAMPMKILRLLPILLALWAFLASAAPADDPVTLNFVNADIDAVVRAVSEMTGRNFVVDPRVKGTINIVSARPVPRSAVYPTLLSALRLQGFAAIEGDGVTKIVPEADAKQQGSPVVDRRVGGKR